MKKFYILVLLLAGLVGVTRAQNDPNAKKILDNVSGKLKTYKGVTANFTYTTTDKKNVKRGSVAGQINIKGQKYYIKQGSTEIFCDGAKTWNFNGDSEVTVSAVDNDSKTLSPQKLLSDFYDKDFTYKLISSAGQYHQIQLVPIDKRKNFKQVTVFIDKAKNMITRAIVIDKSDNSIEFKLSNVNTAASLPDSKFTFDARKHPGVEVINQ
ncbi:LolA family protein [Filimonas effusa]|uniref:Outer membrane lipoprotein carrier protein LolA n=1 Tax=Filimonas effusa TaxID=2508721 RepID=A0A4V1MAG5_9BACT|nr:outer membrane lipoprotein carrier protein LolA [Filimonas effusa]RXK85796.1 outer membrane lipoprotein carrier protein LolA [Filimonas effusa]